jgi:hypothetical protein
MLFERIVAYKNQMSHTIVDSHHSCDIILLLRTRMQKATIGISLKSLSLITCGTLKEILNFHYANMKFRSKDSILSFPVGCLGNLEFPLCKHEI